MTHTMIQFYIPVIIASTLKRSDKFFFFLNKIKKIIICFFLVLFEFDYFYANFFYCFFYLTTLVLKNIFGRCSFIVANIFLDENVLPDE